MEREDIRTGQQMAEEEAGAETDVTSVREGTEESPGDSSQAQEEGCGAVEEDCAGSSEAEPEEAAERGEETEECGTVESGREESGSAEDGEEARNDREDGTDSAEGEASGKPGKKPFWKKKEKDKKDEKIEELKDQVMRQMAEFENFRRRSEKEKSSMYALGEKGVIEKILPVVDNFERGLASAGEENQDPFVEGMRKIYRQLMTALESIGVKPIEAVGKSFDPAVHNAVMHCEDEEAGENVVVEEFQKGYMLGDSVVRHSMVKVAN